MLRRDLVFDAGEDTEFPFDADIMAMGIVDNLAGQGDIFVVRQVRTVDHHRGETAIDTRFADFKRVAVVEVEADGDIGAHLPRHLHRPHRHVTEHGGIGVVTGPLAHLNDHR